MLFEDWIEPTRYGLGGESEMTIRIERRPLSNPILSYHVHLPNQFDHSAVIAEFTQKRAVQTLWDCFLTANAFIVGDCPGYLQQMRW